jgi:hypothetical protein
MFHDKIIAAIRTGCAALGAYVLTWCVSLLTGWGLDVTLDPELQTMLVGLLFAAFIALYNLAVAYLTENVWDGFGWLLGVNKPPAYVDADFRDHDGGAAVDEVTPGLPTVEGGETWQGFLNRSDRDPHRN